MSVGVDKQSKDKRPPAFDSIDGGRGPNNSGGHANWVTVTRERPRDKPFFFWFASYDAHRDWDADGQWDASAFGPMHRAEDVIVPPFLIDDLPTRRDLASYYNEVTRFDYFIGEVVRELKDQDVFENTLIFVLADNGRPFPRAKTRLHDSGMKTALIAHWPAGMKQPAASDSLVSVIDIAPTVLSIADANVPETMQGVTMQPLFADPSTEVRKYAFSEHNWHDYEAHGRSVRDGRFLYIQNNRVDTAWQGPADSVRSPSHRQLRGQRDRQELSPAQQDVFLAPRPSEELYLTSADPHQLNNLIDDEAYADDVARLREVMAEWTQRTGDTVPEQISADAFDRETGESLKQAKQSYRGTTPGEERKASRINHPGPR
ncbi:MAG: sulfatase-like hydrolase/transferase [Pirellulaceae bacterium]